MASISDHNAQLQQNLLDAGCDSQLIECCTACFHTKNRQKIRMLLHAQRQKLMGNIHRSQKQLDCLDYLLHQMAKDEKREVDSFEEKF